MSSIHGAIVSFPRALPAGPSSWPEASSTPVDVREAEVAFHDAVAAWKGDRRAVRAEVTLDPEVRVVRRDDPRRAPVISPTLTPSAHMVWDPLRSETLLAEARVFEALAAWREAWCEALIDAWRGPVVRARAAAEYDMAKEALAEVVARGEPDDSLAMRDARLAVEEAVSEVEEATSAWREVVPDGREELRWGASLPGPRPVEETAGFMATTLRATATLARTERRRVAAFLPSLGVEVGYAGSQARVEARWTLREGRQRAALEGALTGTPQERGWAEVSASFRFGSNARDVEDAVRDAQRDFERVRAAFLEERDADLASTTAALAIAEERWRIAEARVVDERTLDRARVAYGRYLSSLERAAIVRGVWPSFHQ